MPSSVSRSTASASASPRPPAVPSTEAQSRKKAKAVGTTREHVSCELSTSVLGRSGSFCFPAAIATETLNPGDSRRDSIKGFVSRVAVGAALGAVGGPLGMFAGAAAGAVAGIFQGGRSSAESTTTSSTTVTITLVSPIYWDLKILSESGELGNEYVPAIPREVPSSSPLASPEDYAMLCSREREYLLFCKEPVASIASFPPSFLVGPKSVTVESLPGAFKTNPSFNFRSCGSGSEDAFLTTFDLTEKDGQQPAKPLRVTFSKNGPDSIGLFNQTALQLHYYDPEKHEWRLEDSENIYIRKDEASNAIHVSFLLRHLSRFRLSTVGPPGIRLDDFHNPHFDQVWPVDQFKNWRLSRGGRDYYAPAGFSRTSTSGVSLRRGGAYANVSEGQTKEEQAARFDAHFANFPVVFHGTRPDAAINIVANHFQPRERLSGHIDLGVRMFGIDNYADAYFTSPSYRYAAWYGGYVVQDAAGLDWVRAGCATGNNVVVALVMCRIRPGSYTPHPSTIHAITRPRWADPHYPPEQLEWRVPRDSVNGLVVYGICIREMSREEYIHEFQDCQGWDA